MAKARHAAMLELLSTVIASTLKGINSAKQSRYGNLIEVLDCRATIAMTGLTASTFHQALAGNGEARSHA
jgi:hypothetical protein